jgi:hypothetical protein
MRLRQSGELRLNPESRWLRFSAGQELSVRDVAFERRARVQLPLLVTLRVLDRLAGGEGASEVRLLGRRVSRETGPHVTAGSVLRYLAELPWNPHAIAANPGLGWHELDSRTVEVTTAGSPPLRLGFDADGMIATAWTQARPRREGATVVERPWGGVFSGYGPAGGVVLPRRAEVTWELPDGPFTWFRCEIAADSYEPIP